MCAMKVDLMKVFGSLSLSFLDNLMRALNFPEQFKKWVCCCISSTWFCIAFNFSLVGFFKGKKGIRQGDYSLLTYLSCHVDSNIIIKLKIAQSIIYTSLLLLSLV